MKSAHRERESDSKSNNYGSNNRSHSAHFHTRFSKVFNSKTVAVFFSQNGCGRGLALETEEITAEPSGGGVSPIK